jgi:hypothetical protein
MAVPAKAEAARPSGRGEKIHPGLVGGPIYLDYNATTPVDPRVAEAALAAVRHAVLGDPRRRSWRPWLLSDGQRILLSVVRAAVPQRRWWDIDVFMARPCRNLPTVAEAVATP